MNYYLWIEGQEHGPYSLDQLRTAVGDGSLNERQTARAEGSHDWKSLDEIATVRLPQMTEAPHERAVYIYRSETTLGPFPVSEAYELLKGGHLLANDIASESESQLRGPLIQILFPDSPGDEKRRLQLANRLSYYEQSLTELEALLRPTVYRCPNCGSETVQNVKVLYESGTATGRGTGVTGGIVGSPEGDPPLIVSRTMHSFTSRTELATRLCPPAEPKNTSSAVLLCMLGGVFGLFGLILLFAAVRNEGLSRQWGSIVGSGGISLVLLWLGFRRTKDEDLANSKRQYEYQRSFLIWAHSYFCHRCGYVGALN